jgi:type IV pilus biogenesis protein CpaD/CtpE
MAGAVLAIAATLAGCGGDAGPLTGLEDEAMDCGGRVGCASAHNLAATVARPSDLVMPRREGPRDARRREVLLGAWRNERAPTSQGAAAPRQQDTTP